MYVLSYVRVGHRVVAGEALQWYSRLFHGSWEGLSSQNATRKEKWLHRWLVHVFVICRTSQFIRSSIEMQSTYIPVLLLMMN